jgi:hypothetical protein
MAERSKSSGLAQIARSTAVRRLIAGALLLAGTTGLSASSASAQSCQQLWVERNSYYKDAGYCFKTRRAIAFFGNAGCAYDDEGSVPLPRGIRARIADITATERSRGCN